MGADPRLQDWINVDMRSAAQGYAKNAQLFPAWQVFCSGLSPLGPSPPERRAPDAAAEHARNGPAVPETRVRPDGADPEAPPRKGRAAPRWRSGSLCTRWARSSNRLSTAPRIDRSASPPDNRSPDSGWSLPVFAQQVGGIA